MTEKTRTETRSSLVARHERIDDSPPCGRLVNVLPADSTGNGRPDLLVSGWGRTAEVSLPVRSVKLTNAPYLNRLYHYFEPNVLWYENLNPGWKRHVISRRGNRYLLGGTLGDIDDDDGRPAIVGKLYVLSRHVDVWYNETTV